MYMTLKMDDSVCRIHSISDGNEEIVTNQMYMVMPWKMVTRRGANVALKEAVEEIEKEGRRKDWSLNLKPNIEMKQMRFLG